MEKETAIPGLEERKLPEFNAMQRVKRRFFAMRNGDLAQQMAERGARYRINFGLNLPQVSEIARDFLPGGKEHMAVYGGQPPLPEDLDMADFARRLRDNTSTRESMLIAPMLFPVEALSEEEALEWMRSVPTPEVADVLCLKLLRNHPSAARMRRLRGTACCYPLDLSPAAWCATRLCVCCLIFCRPDRLEPGRLRSL